MSDKNPQDDRGIPAVKLTDPRALRALAHPIRLALVGLLRAEGPLTATQAGERLGESSASCSFHLRQLARYGLVEDAGGGRGRERPWRATARSTQWPDIAPTGEMAAAAQLFEFVVAEHYFQQTLRWVERRHDEPPEWQEAAQFGDTTLHVTAAELAEIKREVYALVSPYVERMERHELRPRGARRISFLHLAFPSTPDATDPGPPPDGTDPAPPDAGRSGKPPDAS